jgi:hypothetical protein
VPVATVQVEAIEHYDLKSLPTGWVSLRRMTYGQKLGRMQSTTSMSLAMRKGAKDVQGKLETMQMAAALFDFKTCVVDHNLTDPAERKLDFNSPQDMSTLDPRVGEEIATYIDKLNNFEEDDEVGNSESASVLQS